MSRFLQFLLGLPALVVGVGSIAFMLVTYRTEPSSIVESSQKLIENHLKEYSQLDDHVSTLQERMRIAADIELSYQQMASQGLDSVDWRDRLNFYEQHLASMSELRSASTKLGLQEHLGLYREKRDQALAKLTENGSPHAEYAAIRIAELALEQQDSVNIESSLQRLESLAGEKLAKEPNRVVVLIAKLLIEQAWNGSYSSLEVVPNPDKLTEALRYLEGFEPVDEIRELKIAVLAHLNPPAAMALAVNLPPYHSEKKQYVAVSALVSNDYSGLSSIINASLEAKGEAGSENARLLRRNWSQQICRLLLSGLPRASSSWCTNAPTALNIAYALDINSSEMLSLLWQLSSTPDHHSMLAPELVECLLISPELRCKRAIELNQAVKANDPAQAIRLLDNQPDPVLTHFATQAMWISARSKECGPVALEVLQTLCTRHPQNPFLLFSCATVSMNLGDLIQARKLLQEAERIGYDSKSVRILLERCSQLESQG